MADKPTPTPTELKAMWQLHAADIGGIFDFASAVLAKWGQPAGAGEAAEHYRNAIASACEGWTMPDGLRKHLETALWSLPTQTQAGAVPLTDEQIAEMMRDTWGCASIAPRHAPEFARAVERAHGITQKGGSNADT